MSFPYLFVHLFSVHVRGPVAGIHSCPTVWRGPIYSVYYSFPFSFAQSKAEHLGEQNQRRRPAAKLFWLHKWLKAPWRICFILFQVEQVLASLILAWQWTQDVGLVAQRRLACDQGDREGDIVCKMMGSALGIKLNWRGVLSLKFIAVN